MTPFESLHPDSRIWLYQSDRDLNESEVHTFNVLSETFLENWESHGQPVKGGIKLLHNRFILVYIDEKDERSCGRSVDASIRFIKELENELKVSLLDRMRVSYMDGEKISTCKTSDFSRLAQQGKVNANTKIYDVTLHKKEELINQFEKKTSDSWAKALI